MKARVKATGEIVEVTECGQTFKDMRMDYMDMKGRCYESEDLDFSNNTPFDYWTRLEHQYAGMAMQALLSSDTMMEVLSRRDNGRTMEEEVAREAFDYAHALVEKYKKEEK